MATSTGFMKIEPSLLKSLEVFLGRILGKPAPDPLATITADQLHIVLRSIEDKYTLLQDENRRLQQKVEDQQKVIMGLEKALKDRSPEGPGPSGQEDLRRV